MPSADLQSFVKELERRGWLRRVRVEVDPMLEISEITDRVTKSGGPALLFENVRPGSAGPTRGVADGEVSPGVGPVSNAGPASSRSSPQEGAARGGPRCCAAMPVLINTFGAKERMCLALGAESFEEIAERVQVLIKPEIPTTLMEKLKKLPQLMQLGSLPPRVVKRGVCQEVVHREDADLTALPAIKCWPADGDLSRNVYSHVREIVDLARGKVGRWESGNVNPGPGMVGESAARAATVEGNASASAARAATAAGDSTGPRAMSGESALPTFPLSHLSTNEGSEHSRELLEGLAAAAGSLASPGASLRGPVASSLRGSDLVPPPNDGRYLTLTNVFTKHPETGERNIGMYRVQILGPKLAAMHWHMHHDGARHFRAYKRLGRRMPVAVSFGGPSVIPYAATCPLPPGIDECLFAGFLNGGAIELVPCVSQPEIEAPATAEVVVEGYIDPSEPPVIEGPFGDHTGYYSLADLYPRLHVTAITHRQNAIYPTTIVGKPPQEDFWLGKATERIFLPLLRTIVPDIIDYNLPMFGCFHNCAFVKIRKEYPYQARRVMSAIWGAGQMAFTKIIVVVDEHVDVHSEQDVLFHLCANVDPRRDILFVDGPLDILDHAAPICGAGSKMGIDATRKWPGEGQVRSWPEELEMSAEIRERVTRRWKDYGL